MLSNALTLGSAGSKGSLTSRDSMLRDLGKVFGPWAFAFSQRVSNSFSCLEAQFSEWMMQNEGFSKLTPIFGDVEVC